MKILSKISISIIFPLFGCIDELTIPLLVDEPRLVVDALITSVPGESTITIGWTFPMDEGCISDYGNFRYPIPCQPDTSSGLFQVTGKLTITRESHDPYEVAIHMAERKRFIVIHPDIAGMPGENFSLDIEIIYNNKTNQYHAETVMLQTPAIDSMSYIIRNGDVGKNDNFVPLVYFKEPQDQKNYYLFHLCPAGGKFWCGRSDRVWSYSIIRDDFLPAYVSGLSIDDGATVAKYAEFYPDVSLNGGVQVRMCAINRETYDFYKALLDQFNNDGGAYSPTPATPTGNISGGAIGLFRAVHESMGEVYP